MKAIHSILLAALLSGTGCRSVAYYTQAAAGQCEIVFGQKTISKILKDPEASPELRAQLKLVLELREFARVERSHDEKHCVRTRDPGFVDLIGIDDEVLSQQGQRRCCAIPGQIAEFAAKKVLVGQDRERRRAAFRRDDADEVMEIIKANGGMQQIHLAFYKDQQSTDDKLRWNYWRLEGHGFIWNYRVLPHVHCYVNIVNT